MRKLRYGREATLRQVELELAEEAERNGAQRERRRRSAETRAVARPPNAAAIPVPVVPAAPNRKRIRTRLANRRPP